MLCNAPLTSSASTSRGEFIDVARQNRMAGSEWSNGGARWRASLVITKLPYNTELSKSNFFYYYMNTTPYLSDILFLFMNSITWKVPPTFAALEPHPSPVSLLLHQHQRRKMNLHWSSTSSPQYLLLLSCPIALAPGYATLRKFSTSYSPSIVIDCMILF